MKMSRQNCMHDRLSYYYNWTPVFENSSAFRAVIREFLDNGASRFVIGDKITLRLVEEPEKITFLHQICQEMEVDFCSVHGMAGPNFELNIPDAEMRACVLNNACFMISCFDLVLTVCILRNVSYQFRISFL